MPDGHKKKRLVYFRAVRPLSIDKAIIGIPITKMQRASFHWITLAITIIKTSLKTNIENGLKETRAH